MCGTGSLRASASGGSDDVLAAHAHGLVLARASSENG